MTAAEVSQSDDPSAVAKLRVGISTCLLGAKVRYDGEHKRDAFLVEQLGPFVEWVPVCPEVEVGMGVPREAVRLVRGADAEVRMVGTRSGEDWTARMRRFADKRVRALDDLRGYVLKSKSPSCGLLRVKVYPVREDGTSLPGMASRDGVGVFAEALRRRWPNLPIEEEGRLNDAALRENFIERLFAYDRVRRLWQTRWRLGDLVAFHTAHKMALLAHSEPGYRELGRVVAAAKGLPRAELRELYERRFMEILGVVATRSRHSNVLSHMFGFLRKQLDAGDKAELLGVLEDYRRGLVPLIVPITLLRHHVGHLGVAYLRGQSYLEPHPKELMLRNRV